MDFPDRRRHKQARTGRASVWRGLIQQGNSIEIGIGKMKRTAVFAAKEGLTFFYIQGRPTLSAIHSLPTPFHYPLFCAIRTDSTKAQPTPVKRPGTPH